MVVLILQLFPIFSKVKANTTRFSMDNDNGNISQAQPIIGTNLALNEQVANLLIASKFRYFHENL